MTGDLYHELLPLLDSPSRDPVRERPPSAGRIWSFCPCHADGTKHGKRSLSLHPTYGLTCFAGCEFRDVIRTLRERAGVHRWHPTPNAPHRSRNGTRSGQLGQVTGRWTYEGATGATLFRVVRLDGPQGKTFLQQHPAGAGECCDDVADPCKPVYDAPGWQWGHGRGVPHALYRLPELLEADPDDLVFIVEGERCADALGALGLVATTCDGGAGKWRAEQTEPLRGRRVVILPDNDCPGADHAETVTDALLDAAAEVRVVILPGLPFKGDVVNWLARGGTCELLLELVERTPIARHPSAMFPKAVDVRVLDTRGLALP